MLKIIFIVLIHTLLGHSVLWTETADPGNVNDVAFHKLGTYRGFTDDGSEYQKSYFFPKYSNSPWAEGRSFCHSYGLELLSMDTLEEARAVLTMADNHSVLRALPYVWLFIDSVTQTIKSPTDWYWTKSGKKISYPIPWRPGTPDNYRTNEYCLTFGKATINEKFGFDDATCDGVRRFTCQRIEISIP